MLPEAQNEASSSSRRRVGIVSRQLMDLGSAHDGYWYREPATLDEGAERAVLLVGSIISDVQAEVDMPPSTSFSMRVANQASWIGKVTHAPGGVCLNIARALRGLGSAASLVSAVGTDGAGRELLELCSRTGIRTEGVLTIEGARTATVLCLFNGEGQVVFSLADVRVLDERVTPAMALSRMDCYEYGGGIVVADGDLPSDVLEAVCRRARGWGCAVCFDPATVSKAPRCLPALPFIDYLAPNTEELLEIARAIDTTRGISSEESRPPGRARRRTVNGDGVPDVFFRVAAAVDAVLGRGARHVLLTAGKYGAGLYWSCETGIRLAHCPALPANSIASVNGAGDCLLAGFVRGLSLGRRKEEALALGVSSAAQALETKDNVPDPFDAARLAADARSLTTRLLTLTLTF